MKERAREKKEEKKQWGRKGKVMKMRGEVGKKRERRKNGQKVSLKARGERKRDREGVSCVLYVWCGSHRAGQMVSMNRI